VISRIKNSNNDFILAEIDSLAAKKLNIEGSPEK
jgi:hypothetical protein